MKGPNRRKRPAERGEAAGLAPPSPRGAEKPVRKNYYLYQSKIDLAKEVLRVNTETEAVDRALDLLIYGEALAAGTEAMAGETYIDYLGVADEVPTEPPDG